MDPQVLLPPGAGLVVEQVQLCGEIIHLTVRCEAAGANCRTVVSGRKPSTAAMSVTLAICRSLVGRLLSTYGSAAFGAIR